MSGREYIGSRNTPGYNFRPDASAQPTLDGFRAYSIFSDLVPSVEEVMDGELETAIMYGSNVNGLSAFPDSELYDWDSDMDLLFVVDIDDFSQVRSTVKSVLDHYEVSPEVNVDMKNGEEFLETLETLQEADKAEEVLDSSLRIDYSDHYFEKSAPERMRAFGTGYIPHPEYDEHSDAIDQALENIFILMDEDPELRQAYGRNAREYTGRISEMQDSEPL
jgi:hypothetical protein